MLVTHWGGGASWSADPGPHPHEAGLLAVDASQARHELDWRPRLDLGDAVRWTVDWYRRERAGEDAATLIRAQIGDYAASRAV